MRLASTQGASGRRVAGGPRAGFTLLEVSLYMTLVLLIGAPLVSVVLMSTRSTEENDTFNRVTERNRTAIQRIEKELRSAIQSTVSVTDSGRTLTFNGPNGYDGAAVVVGQRVSYSLVAREAVNGFDDNANGVIDEGDLVRTNLGTGEQVTITAAADVGASGFAAAGTGWTVAMTTQGALRSQQRYEVSRRVTVYPRN